MIEVPKLGDVSRIVADRTLFNGVLYMPIDEAYAELKRRRQDAHLEKQVSEFLGGNVLEPLREKPRAVIARSVVSPNYEVRRFADLVNERKEIEPLYLEYRADKFTSNNESKRMLGRLYFFNGKGKSGNMRTESLNIVDFSTVNGKHLSSVKTLWGQDFVDFHHELFDTRYMRLSPTFFDASHWLDKQGKTPGLYYRAFLALFIRHGILFENVLLNKEEMSFTMRVFLPAFLSVYQQFGLKPIIVSLEPMNTEGSRFWTCYPGPDKEYVRQKMKDLA